MSVRTKYHIQLMRFSDLWVGFFGALVLFCFLCLLSLFVFSAMCVEKQQQQQYCGICPQGFSCILGLVSCFPTMLYNVALSPYTCSENFNTCLFILAGILVCAAIVHICVMVIILVNGLPVHDRGLLSIFSGFVAIKSARL